MRVLTPKVCAPASDAFTGGVGTIEVVVVVASVNNGGGRGVEVGSCVEVCNARKSGLVN